jgi:hypothetical protein
VLVVVVVDLVVVSGMVLIVVDVMRVSVDMVVGRIVDGVTEIQEHALLNCDSAYVPAPPGGEFGEGAARFI